MRNHGTNLTHKPDSRFIIVSSRGESSIKIPNFDKTNSTQIPSDPLISYSVDPKNGNLTLVQTFPAGGLTPRHFSLNKAGTLIASALQGSSRVAVIARDPESGTLIEFVNTANVAGEVNCAIFAE
jgi:6-phosphogluconolactonase (cycloisomerase 2 family)